MNVNTPINPQLAVTDATRTAVGAIQEQQDTLDRNVVEASRAENTNSSDEGSQDRALVEQSEIVRTVQANAQSLEAANGNVGTLIDIKV